MVTLLDLAQFIGAGIAGALALYLGYALAHYLVKWLGG